MKFTVQREALLKPLQMMSNVVERRQTMPILANVLMTVEKNKLTLVATDLEIELIGFVPLNEECETGSVTVSARKLLDICRSLPENAMLQVTMDAQQVLIRAGKSRFVLTTLPVHEFPVIGEVAFSTKFNLPQIQLKRLLSNVHFAMGQQDVRHYLNGALFDVKQDVVKCVATDGHRLAYSTYSAPECHASAKIILPRKSVMELIRLMETDQEGLVNLSVGDNHFRAETADYIFTTKLINAQYPDYEKLIPRQIENTMTTPRETLKQALSRASILLNDKFRGIRMQLETDIMRITSNNPEQEEAEELIHLDYQGNHVEFGFNVSYLLDVISILVSDTIRWSFNNPDTGVIIESPDNDQSLYVVMPMRL